MANGITDARKGMAAALTAAGYNAYDSFPGAVSPPLVYVAPGDPYVTREGATFGGSIVNCDVVVVGEAGANDTQAEALDQLILDVRDALEATGYGVGAVSEVGTVTLGQTKYLAATLAAATEIRD